MLYTLIMLILIVWLAGLILQIGGPLIHALLVIAGLIYIVQLVSGRRAT